MSIEALKVLQFLVHYSLHLLVPGLIAWIFWRDSWLKVWFIMLATMLVDLDHLLANPIFDPGRCSIGFHPLHTWPAIVLYALMLIPSRTRIVAVALLLHMFTDWQDCLWRYLY